jgi:uncharacterized protein YjhX (UPF0386 family)
VDADRPDPSGRVTAVDAYTRDVLIYILIAVLILALFGIGSL